MMKPLDSFNGTDEEEEDTVELQLSAEQLRVLAEASAGRPLISFELEASNESLPPPPPPIAIEAEALETPMPPHRRSRHPVPAAWALGIAAATFAATGFVYVASNWPMAVTVGAQRTAATPAAVEIPTPVVAKPVPVRFTNPFDESEIFEFPAGTTDLEARDAVAALLLERARERQRSASSRVTASAMR